VTPKPPAAERAAASFKHKIIPILSGWTSALHVMQAAARRLSDAIKGWYD